MKHVPFYQVKMGDGFWKNKQTINLSSTIENVYQRFYETGRVDAFRCLYQEGDQIKPHVYWDSDVAKWMEAVCMIYQTHPEAMTEQMKRVEDIIDCIEQSRDENGYYNCYYLTQEKDKRFTNRHNHELYCAGHLMEAAVEHYRATGSKRFLSLMEDYADYIDRIFYQEQSAGFTTPGHQEIELALVKLYQVTGKEKYLTLSRFFLDMRGRANTKKADVSTNGSDIQSHVPVLQQWEAVGHAVRASYMYCAMADHAKLKQDPALTEQCKAIFRDIATKKMFITGGVGSNSRGESFADAYYLPNLNAYAETCAAIALCFFASRMQEIHKDSIYADVIERAIYNGALSGVSLGGDEFFYENPLALCPKENDLKNMHYPITHRVKVFNCSCCPPNIARFIASLGNYFYSTEEDTLFVHQFASGKVMADLASGKAALQVDTDYPHSGVVRFQYQGPKATLAIRIPSWSKAYADQKARDGYLYLPVTDGQSIQVDLEVQVCIWEANPLVRENQNQVAVSRGPVVYCLEEADNGANLAALRLPLDASFDTQESDYFGVPTLLTKGKRLMDSDALYAPAGTHKEKEVPLTLIPYFGFANRQEGEMRVWIYK